MLAVLTSSSSKDRPSGCSRSNVISRLFRFTVLKAVDFSAPLLSIHSCVASHDRHQSKRSQLSTLITSAPISAMCRQANGPAHPILRSIIRIPFNSVAVTRNPPCEHPNEPPHPQNLEVYGTNGTEHLVH